MSFIEDLSSKFSTFTEDHMMNMIVALLCLALGLILIGVAVLILKKFIFPVLKLNHYFAKLTGRMEPLFNLERTLIRLFFLISILAVFASAAQFAQVDYLVDLFDGIFGWIGKIAVIAVSALRPITLALIFSYLARTGIMWLGQKAKLDDRLGNKLDAGEAVSFSLTKSVSEIAYGVVFLYFLPEILKGIGLEQLSGPITKMFEDVVAFFPRLIVAGIIIFLGWFVARLVRQTVEGLLVSMGIDNVIKKVFGDNALGALKISKVVPTIIYVFIIVLAVVQALGKLELETITAPIEELLNSAVQGLPTVVFAVLSVLVAVYIGGIVSGFVSGLLKDVGFDNVYAKLGLSDIKTGAKTPSQIIGFLVSATLVVVITMQALGSLGLDNLSEILNTLIYRFIDIMVGILVFGIGLYVAKNVSSWVEHATQAQYAKFLGLVSKVVIIVISGAMALQQVGIADEIVTIAFALAMGSIALGVAIAIGLGSKDVAGEVAKDFVAKLRK
ncbi:MAG: mechanosensitive ion channel [Bdellovibrionales bacterium]